MSIQVSDHYPDWQQIVKLLNDSAWKDAEVSGVKVDHWLRNFSGQCVSEDVEQQHAFHLLTQFMFFGRKELDECLRVLFQEKFVYPFVQQQKRNTNDLGTISNLLERQLDEHTRFVGVGNPAESGTSLLYSFRKANDLPTNVFTTTCDAVVVTPSSSQGGNSLTVTLDPPDLDHLIFLDDFCATGDQVQKRAGWVVNALRKSKKSVKVSYFLLVATSIGLRNLRKSNLFDDVNAVVVFDEDYKVFSSNSHYYSRPHDKIDKSTGERVMRHYGDRLGFSDPHALGFQDSQLLIGFQHNTPDNTLPTFWHRDSSPHWYPIFPRAEKH